MTLLSLFISSDASICSTMASPSLGISDHVVFSDSIGYPTNSKQDAPFHHIVDDYSHVDWDSLCDHLRHVSWEVIFKLSAFAADWVQVGADVYIPHCTCQVKPHSPLWFSAACAAAIVHRNLFFCCCCCCFIFINRVNLLNIN